MDLKVSSVINEEMDERAIFVEESNGNTTRFPCTSAGLTAFIRFITIEMADRHGNDNRYVVKGNGRKLDTEDSDPRQKAKDAYYEQVE